MSKREKDIYNAKNRIRKKRINIRIPKWDYNYFYDNDRQMANKADKKVSDAIEKWLASKEKTLKPSSIAKYRNLANKHIMPLLGDKSLYELDDQAFRAFVGALSEGKTGDGVILQRNTARCVLMILEKSVKLAGGSTPAVEKDESIGRSAEKRRITVLSDAEQLKLEQYLLSDTDEKKLGLLLCLYAGLRIGEICAMRWSCIDLSERTLTVASTMQRIQITENTDGKRTEVIETAPKSADSRRIVPIADFLADLLREKKPTMKDAFLLTGSDRYIEPRSYENYYKRALAAAGIHINNFHTMRHTFATRCIESGVDVKTLSELLGHSTVKLTLDRYVHPTMDAKHNSINLLAVNRRNMRANA